MAVKVTVLSKVLKVVSEARLVVEYEGPFHMTCGKTSGSSGSLKNKHLSVTWSFSLCSNDVTATDVKAMGSVEGQTETKFATCTEFHSATIIIVADPERTCISIHI